MTELGRVVDAHRPNGSVAGVASAASVGGAPVFDVTVSVHPQRGALSLILRSGGSHPKEGGWRVALAKTFLTQVGGSVDPLPRENANFGAGFEVRFRFQ